MKVTMKMSTCTGRCFKVQSPHKRLVTCYNALYSAPDIDDCPVTWLFTLATMLDNPLFRVGRLLHDTPDISISLIIKTCIIALIILPFRGVLRWLLSMFLIPLSDPLRHLPGPPGSYFQNHFREVLE